jgi:hypothetical protein
MRTFRLYSGLGLLAMLASLPAAADSGSYMPSVWKEQHVEFSYFGRTSRYTCDGMRDKVLAMLIDLGARRDLRISTHGCDDFRNHLSLHGMNPSLSIVFSSPAAAEVTAKPLHAGDLAAVDARFEAFTLTSDAFRNMGIGDCELVEEFARQILPKLATRGVKRDINCVPYQVSGNHYLIKGEVLKVAPRSAAQAAGS